MSETTSFVIEQVGSFEGSYPEIANRPDFQLDDGDTDPVFMTLPIGEVGNTSRNKRTYSESFYKELVRLINEREKPVQGIKGHRDPEKISTETRLPVIEWVGATLDEDGTAWGKAYVYPEYSDVRANVRRAKKRGMKVATSVWGNGYRNPTTNEIDGIEESMLSLDYVESLFAGVTSAVGIPEVTQETIQTSESVSQSEGDGALPETLTTTETIEDKNIMAEEKHNADVIQLQETINQLQTYKNQFSAISEMLGTTEVSKAIRELQRRNTELEPLEETVNSVKAELGGTNDLVEAIQELKTDRDAWRNQATGFTAKNLIDAKVKLPEGRALVAEMIGLDYSNPNQSTLETTDVTALAELIDNKLAKPHTQMMLQSIALKVSGGHAYVGDGDQPIAELDDSPAAMRKARANVGF